MSNLHYNRSILFHSFLQNFLNSLILEGSPARTESSCPWASGHKVMGRHSPSGFVCIMFLLECCVSFVPDVMEPMCSRKFYFWLISPENIIQKFWGSWRCFLVNLRWTLCLLFGQHWFTLSNLYHGCHFSPVPFVLWSHEHWPLSVIMPGCSYFNCTQLLNTFS